MILRKVLNLNQTPGVSARAVGTVKLYQSTRTPVGTHGVFHCVVLFHAALGEFPPEGERKLNFAFRAFKHIQNGGF